MKDLTNALERQILISRERLADYRLAHPNESEKWQMMRLGRIHELEISISDLECLLLKLKIESNL